tara:strand:+ start:389 stop:1225 length:837 start_codon:yes stop_codon:yes gene_type:complete
VNKQPSIIQVIKIFAHKLQKKGFSNAKNELLWYLESLNIDYKNDFYLNKITVDSSLYSSINEFYLKRKRGIPFQYIIQKGTFYGRDFFVNKHTLIPRPETETIINQLKNSFFNDVLEVGTGSGVLAITLSIENIAKKIIATDISSKALSIANKNKNFFKVSNIDFKKHDFLNQPINKKFDLIISNPPYISLREYNNLSLEIKNNEPLIALTDNKDGLTFYLRFAQILHDILKPGGVFLCEIGSPSVNEKIKQLFINKGYNIQIFKDLNLDERILKITL